MNSNALVAVTICAGAALVCFGHEVIGVMLILISACIPIK